MNTPKIEITTVEGGYYIEYLDEHNGSVRPESINRKVVSTKKELLAYIEKFLEEPK